jgi:hypothetical protein
MTPFGLTLEQFLFGLIALVFLSISGLVIQYCRSGYRNGWERCSEGAVIVAIAVTLGAILFPLFVRTHGCYTNRHKKQVLTSPERRLAAPVAPSPSGR